MEVLYKLWEGSWSDDAIIADVRGDAYFDPDRIRHISHHGKYYNLDTKFITQPSPQRTPFLFQAGTSTAGSAFAVSAGLVMPDSRSSWTIGTMRHNSTC